MMMRSVRFGLLGLSLSVAVVAAQGCSLSVLGALGELDKKPAAPTATGLADACRRNGQFNLSGGRPENTRVIAVVTPDGGASTEVEVAPLAAAPTFTGTLTLEEGVYSVTLVAENGAQVRSDETAAATLSVDTTVPGAPAGTAPAAAIAGLDLDLDLTSDADVEEVVCTNAGGVAADVTGGEGAFVAALPIVSGTNTFTCTASDACGNDSDAAVFTISGDTDVVAPPVVVVEPVSVRLADGETEATITASGTTEANTTVEMSINGGTAETLPVPADPLTWSIDLTLTAGDYAISLVAVRGAARSTPTVMNVSVGGELAAPASACPVSPLNDDSLHLTGTRPAGTSVQVLVGDETPVTIAAASGSTSWSGNFDISDRSDGSLTYRLQAVDAIGGGAESIACVVSIDRTAPDAPVVDPVVAVFPVGTSSGLVDFTGTGEVGAHVRAGLDGGAVSERTIIDDTGTFTFQLTVTVAGNPHSIAVSLVDEAGNTSAVTTEPFTVRNALVRPSLTTPASAAFPVFTNASSINLVGTRPSTVGVLARFTDASPDLELVANGTVGSSFNVPVALATNTTISFCLYSFDATTESDARCLPGNAPFTITQDSVVPSDPVVTITDAVQTPTVDASVNKEAGASVAVKVNGGGYATLVPATNTATTVSVTGVALTLGANTVCFKSVDQAGNESGEDCFSVTRTEPAVVLNAPLELELLNGTTVPVDAAMVDTTAVSFTVCTTTGVGAPVCQTLDADGAGNLVGDVDIGAAPAAATPVSVEVCGTDGVVTACATRVVLRWGAPEQVTDSVSTEAKLSPAVAVDGQGVVHLVWQDVSNVCSTGHLDVVTAVSRNAQNRLSISVSRPSEVGLTVGKGLSVFGTSSFNGTYTVRSVTNGVVETNETVASGAPESSGNLVSTDVKTNCAGPDIFYARLDGRGWSTPVNLSDVGGDAASSAPAIVADAGGDIHVVWQEAGNLNPSNGAAVPPSAPADGTKTDLVHRVIDGATGAISLPVVISTQDDSAAPGTSVDDKTPSLAAGAGLVVAAWETVGAANARQVLVSRYSGSAWGTPRVVAARTTTTTMLPSVGIGTSGTVYVAWVENSGRAVQGGTVGTAGDRDILLCPLAPADSACPSGAEILVSNGVDAGNSSEPAVAVGPGDALVADDESVHIVWSDDEGRGASSKRILHRRMSLNRGAGAVLGALQSVTTSGNGQNPTIAVTPGSTEVVIAWTDNSPTGGHSEFTAMTSVGTDLDTNADSVFDQCTFSTPALLFTNAGSFTTADTAPAVALGTARELYVAFAHQPSNAAVDSEIFAFGLRY